MSLYSHSSDPREESYKRNVGDAILSIWLLIAGAFLGIYIEHTFHVLDLTSDQSPCAAYGAPR